MCGSVARARHGLNAKTNVYPKNYFQYNRATRWLFRNSSLVLTTGGSWEPSSGSYDAVRQLNYRFYYYITFNRPSQKAKTNVCAWVSKKTTVGINRATRWLIRNSSWVITIGGSWEPSSGSYDAVRQLNYRFYYYITFNTIT